MVISEEFKVHCFTVFMLKDKRQKLILTLCQSVSVNVCKVAKVTLVIARFRPQGPQTVKVEFDGFLIFEMYFLIRTNLKIATFTKKLD